MTASANDLMVLLVTKRRSGRWVIPKGWAEPDLLPHLLAAREAFEEAGILGEAEPNAIGAYTYRKRLPDGRRAICEVTVFPMRVVGFAETWPEQGQRRSRWATLDEAASLVEEPGLAKLLWQVTSTPLTNEQ
ncbi:NUDIX hydrolase [Roseicella frigidaeris]|nr:NUDIX hydrolase [Roseicella frigidaeris]